MTVVKHQLILPGAGTYLSGGAVSVGLVVNGFVNSGHEEITWSSNTVTDAQGNYSFDLTPNSQITPTGTYYLVKHPNGETLTFIVSDATGPLWLYDLLVQNPAAPSQVYAGIKTVTSPGGTIIPAISGQALTLDVAPGLFHPDSATDIVLIGDSITVLNNTTTGFVMDGITNTTGYPGESWFNQANILMRQRFNVIGVKGVGGQTSGQMLARFPTDVVALAPAYVFIHAGINDFNAVYLESLATYQTNMKAMFALARAAGIKVIVSTIMSPQLDTIPEVDNPAMRANRYAANQWLAAYCAVNTDITLVDWTAAATNPDTGRSDTTNPDGVPVNFPLQAYSADGVHPLTYGSFQMAEVIASRLMPLVADHSQLVGTNQDTTAGTTNPMVSGNTAGFATGWSAGQQFISGVGAAPVYTASKVPAALSDVNASYGSEWQQIALVSGDIEVKSPNTLLSTSGFNVGDLVYGEVEFEADSAGWAMNMFGCGFYSRTAGALQAGAACNVPATTSKQPYMSAGIMRTPAIPIAVGSDRLQFLVIASGAGTFRFRRACVRKVIAP